MDIDEIAVELKHVRGFMTVVRDPITGAPALSIPGMGNVPLQDFVFNSTLRVPLNQSILSAGVFSLPGVASARALKATISGAVPATRAVKIKIFVSNGGAVWIGPETDPSLALVVATTQLINTNQLEIEGAWTHMRFELADAVGLFDLLLEVA